MSKKEHHNRPDLIGEHSFGDAGQLISFIVFTIIYILDVFILKISTFPNEIVPLYVRIPLAVIVFVVSAYLVVKSISIIFGEKREKPEVVRKEIYGRIRHPMYVSEILLYFGLLCLNISLITVGVWILIIVFLYAICRYEEKILIEYFGNDYIAYMKEVPMWIPRLRKKKNNA
ncbi:MAG: isoprenylcysteine carboxylmethyltransferase family protein [Candidatus Marinimicrobia bacterium]|nr:isoprenylcysteine carboxylmethyltransferase family protein [Candidatus Neomarinimicrobiota bacterium]